MAVQRDTRTMRPFQCDGQVEDGIAVVYRVVRNYHHPQSSAGCGRISWPNSGVPPRCWMRNLVAFGNDILPQGYMSASPGDPATLMALSLSNPGCAATARRSIWRISHTCLSIASSATLIQILS